MNITSKIIIVVALMCFCATAAFGQDCNRCLQLASELVSQKKYCDAKRYYQAYGRCNADADVSTEIAMCERLCKINVMEGEESELLDPVECGSGTFPPTKPKGKQTDQSKDDTGTWPDSKDRYYSRFKLGLTPGLLIPTEKAEGAKTYLYFGGGISGEYLVTPNFGIGLSAGFYGYELESEYEEYGIKVKTTPSIIPVTLSGKYYFQTENIKPYTGIDVGLFTIGVKVKSEGESASVSDSFLGFAPVVGLQFQLANTVALDINAKYNLIFSKGGLYCSPSVRPILVGH